MNASIIPLRRPLAAPPLNLKESAKSSMNRLMLAEMTCRKVGHRIRVLRIAHRMSREDMANMVGLTLKEVELLESCKGEPCKTLVKKVSRFFQVPLDELDIVCN